MSRIPVEREPELQPTGLYRHLAKRLPYIERVPSLPTAGKAYRRKIVVVEGGAGVADVVYVCLKSAADTYSWKTVVTG